MRSSTRALAAAASVAVVKAASLADVCTTSYVQSALPTSDFDIGIVIDSSSVTASPVYNASSSGQNFYPDTGAFDFCNVTLAYAHDGRDDQVLLNFWFPTPANFKNRYLSTGGGGLAINSGTTTSGSLPGGVSYGAVSGLTDGGFGSFTTEMDAILLLANGTLNWETVYMFGYQAHHEMTLIGKSLTQNFYSMNSTKLYAYYQGCSEGGREGWSQVQRFADQWDGAITGAPAFRFSYQQVQHIYSPLVEQTLGYAPPPCELERIVNATIAFCDPLDGLTDGVVSRTDLCKLQFNINSTIGLPYSCAATAATTGFTKRQMAAAATPAQNGTVSAQGVAVAAKILDGLHDSSGGRVYLSYQPAADFDDAATTYNSATGEWEVAPSGLGTEFPARFLELLDTDSLSDFANVTYDTLKDWMIWGSQFYADTLQTNYPDLSPFYNAGGKVLHFHGESDASIPTASSVRYHESVRSIMYPNLSFNESTAAMAEWYQLYLIPGAAHCAPSTSQPNGPFPQTNLQVMIDWVENGVQPTTLNATVLAGDNIGENRQICAWPLRPLWSGNTTDSTTPECVYDQASIDTWVYDFDGVKMPVY